MNNMVECDRQETLTDHGLRSPRSGRGSNSRKDCRASQVVSQRNPCKQGKQTTTSDNAKVKDKSTTIKVGTWNVRSLYAAGKLSNVVREMERINIEVLGISEVRWPGSGTCRTDNGTLYYSGNQLPEHPNGVGIIVGSRIGKAVIKFVPYSDRTLLLQIRAQPVNINFIQCYAPTADKPDCEIQAFYKEVKELLKLTKKK